MKKLVILSWIVGAAVVITAGILFLRPEYGDVMHHGGPEERTAYFTGCLAIVTLILAIVSASQIIFLVSADKTAKISADAAHKAAEAAVAAQRPWLKVILKGKKGFKEENGVITAAFDLDIHNFGNSPATQIQSYLSLEYAERDFEKILEEKKSFHETGRGYSLFPGDNINQTIHGFVSDTDFEKMLELGKERKKSDMLVVLYTKYKFIGGRGETQNIYRIGGANELGVIIDKPPNISVNLFLHAQKYYDSVS